ncbi:MAG: UDP-N-acetylglucosamine 2-epimerase [Deltaproteobacteria bacterium]|nr:UDP-N-acetylglucosamine 2-epimerase [Deltaproteobacteria bacterium]
MFKVPCFTLWDETEWIETVQSGWNVLVGSDHNKMMKEIRRLKLRRKSSKVLFGDGRAGERIIKIITKYFRESK